MYRRVLRGFAIALVCSSLAACSTPPTGPSAAGQGPLASQGPLAGIIPQGLPPVPPRIAANPPTALGATRFVAFGDSITYGTLSSFDGSFLYDVPSHAYSVRLQLALSRYYAAQSFSVVNSGVPAESAIDGSRRIQSVIFEHRPQALLLLEGINDLDAEESVATTASWLARTIDTARRSNVTVLVATLPQTYAVTRPSGEFRANSADLIVPYNAEIQRLAAARQNVHVVDLYRAFGTNRSLIGGDGLHPTEQGYEVMATTFLAAIEAAFPVRGSFQ